MTQYELAQMALRSEALRMRVQYLMTKAALAQLAGTMGHCHWAYLREGERYQVPPEMRTVSAHVEGDA